MGIIINTALIMLSAVMLCLGIVFFKRETNSGTFRYMIFFMGIFAFLWCGGYGVMGSCEDFTAAYVFRNIGLFGVVGFITIEFLLLISQISRSSLLRKIFSIVVVSVALFDFIVYSGRNVNVYMREASRTMYYSNDTFAKQFHVAFLASFSLTMICMALIWYRITSTTRELKFIQNAILANVLLIISNIFDTILPMFGIKSFPATAFGVAATYGVIYHYATKYNAFSISVGNLSNYIYNSVGASILVFDTNFRLMLANNSATKLLGIDKIEGTTLDKVFDLHAESISDYITIMHTQDNFESKLKPANSDRSCGINMSLVRDNNHNPYCIIAFVTDLSKEEKMIRDITQASRAKTVFLANMSHEIRTPINAVLGMNELILRESVDPVITGYANNIESASKALLSLVNDILDISRIESGKMEIIPVEYGVASLINDSYNMIQMRAKDKGLKLIVECNNDVPAKLYGDEIRIRQIITNLLTNAVKYTREGQVVLSVSYEQLDNENINLLIKVTDTGIGMTKEGMEILFDSFTRLDEKKNRTIEGTGLGLAITKQMLNLLGGEINVSSEYGKGSEFSVIIPQKIVEKEGVGDLAFSYNSIENKAYKEMFTAPNARILVVDDVDMNLSVFKGLLKDTQIHIDAVLSGEECLKLIRQIRYDLIFMDHMMPEMDGIETYAAMKVLGDNLNQDTPVIMLTANAASDAAQEYKDAGFVDYISKPIKGKNLEKMIMKHLDKSLISKEEVANPGLDEATGLMYCADNMEFYRDMLQTYITNKKLDELVKYYFSEDWENYRICVHAIKSTSRTIGATELAGIAEALENATRTNDLDFVKDNHDNLINCYNKIVNYIKIKYFKK